jgi:hypothetical protein
MSSIDLFGREVLPEVKESEHKGAKENGSRGTPQRKSDEAQDDAEAASARPVIRAARHD